MAAAGVAPSALGAGGLHVLLIHPSSVALCGRRAVATAASSLTASSAEVPEEHEPEAGCKSRMQLSKEARGYGSGELLRLPRGTPSPKKVGSPAPPLLQGRSPQQRGRRSPAPAPGMKRDYGEDGWTEELSARRAIAAEERATGAENWSAEIEPWLAGRREKARQRSGVRLVDKSWYERELHKNRQYNARMRRQKVVREKLAEEQEAAKAQLVAALHGRIKVMYETVASETRMRGFFGLSLPKKQSASVWAQADSRQDSEQKEAAAAER